MKEQKRNESFDITLLQPAAGGSDLSAAEQKCVLEMHNDRQEQSRELESAYRKALNAEGKPGDDR